MSASGGGSFARTALVGAAAAAVAVVASNAVWAVGERTAPASSSGAVELAGSDAVPLVVPLTLVALACWGAVLVLRRRGRRVVAVLGALAGLTAAGVTVAWAAVPTTSRPPPGRGWSLPPRPSPRWRSGGPGRPRPGGRS